MHHTSVLQPIVFGIQLVCITIIIHKQRVLKGVGGLGMEATTCTWGVGENAYKH